MRALFALLFLLLPLWSFSAEPIPPSSELEKRRSRIAVAEAEELVVLIAGGAEGEEVLKDYEYLTGLRSWGGVLILEEVDGQQRSNLFLPPKDPSFELWHGPRAAPDAEALRLTGVSVVHPLPHLKTWLSQRRDQIQRVYLASKNPKDSPKFFEVLKDSVEIVPAWRRIHPFRQIKSEWEIDQLRRAIHRTHQGLMAGAAIAANANHEWEVEAAIEGCFRSLGSPAPGFSSIVGSGERSCILHWQENNGELDRDGVLLMDVGARSGAYTADITRTVPVSGSWTDRQREVYEVVLEAQKAGIAAVKPGATMNSIDAAARKVITEAGFGKYFPHGTSHHVGMDVHDVGPRRPLAPGMVITIEPGIYIAEEKLGIRIEDMVRVTEDGVEVLSKGIPKSAEVMAKWVKSAGAVKPTSKENPAPRDSKNPSTQRLR